MTALAFHGSRAPGHTSLFRRKTSDPVFTFIASLPNKTVEAVRQGGTLLVRLDERAKNDQSPWQLDVLLNNKTYKGAHLSHGALKVLIEEDDVIPVRIEGGRLALRKHDLLLARQALERVLERARTAVQNAETRVRDIETEIIDMSRPSTEIRIGTADGKYEVIVAEKEAYATRHGERWRDLTDAPLTLALARELHGTRAAISALGGDPQEPGQTPSFYGAARDMLRLTLKDGSEIVQDADGRVTATRDGAEVPGLTGDKLTLALAYDLEGARSSLTQLVPGLAKAEASNLVNRDESPGF